MRTNPPVGKTLTGIKIADDKMALLFQTTDGDLVVNVDAECCSHTWIESIENTVMSFPATVMAVEDIDMPDLGSPYRCDVIAYYGCKVTTDRGAIVIDYRNSSNGYYGGSLSWPGETPYGGAYNQNASTNNWGDVSA